MNMMNMSPEMFEHLVKMMRDRFSSSTPKEREIFLSRAILNFSKGHEEVQKRYTRMESVAQNETEHLPYKAIVARLAENREMFCASSDGQREEILKSTLRGFITLHEKLRERHLQVIVDIDKKHTSVEFYIAMMEFHCMVQYLSGVAKCYKGVFL